MVSSWFRHLFVHDKQVSHSLCSTPNFFCSKMSFFLLFFSLPMFISIFSSFSTKKRIGGKIPRKEQKRESNKGVPLEKKERGTRGGEIKGNKKLCRCWDSNPKSPDYKTGALPILLQRQRERKPKAFLSKKRIKLKVIH